MTIAENTESKRTDSTNVSNINNEVLERSSLNEDSQRPEEASNSSTEGNPLLETDGKNSSVKIDVSIAKSNRTDKDEDDRASMNASRKDADDRNVIVPPDGGLRAWMVMIGSFIINGVLFSVINTYSSIYLELQRRLLESGETGASSKAGKFFDCSSLTVYH